MRSLFRLLARPMFGFRVEGEEHVPASGPAVVVAYHRSWLDPACLGAAVPRPIRFLIRHRVYHKPWARWFYRLMGGIPVRERGPGAASALKEALRALRRGELIGIFPEGAVRPEGEPGPLRPGAAMLAVRTGAPVLPVHVDGSARAWPRGQRLPRPAPVQVRIGPVVRADRASVDSMQERIEDALRRLARAAAAAP